MNEQLALWRRTPLQPGWQWLWWRRQWYYIPARYRRFYLPVLPGYRGRCWMGESFSVEMQGLDEVLARINTLASLDAAKTALAAAALHVKGKIAQYPPSTEANAPGDYPKRWYERGYGPRWARKRKPGVGGRRTSETLGRRWTVQARDDGLTQVVGNNVSYGPYVQGPEEEQAGFMAAIGWKSIDQVVEEESETVVGLIESEIDKALEG